MNQNVSRGISLLDQEVPGWRDKIDWDLLDMSNCFRCILGQLFGDYADGVDYLKVTGAVFGFDIKPYQTREEHVKSFEVLTELWQQEARAALAAVDPHPGTTGCRPSGRIRGEVDV